MKLGYTIIYVPSVPATLEFYEAAFGLPTRFCVPDKTYGEMELGSGTTLSFSDENFARKQLETAADAATTEEAPFRVNRRKDRQAAGVEIGLLVDETRGESVQAIYDKAVAAGATGVKAPTRKPWGQQVAYVRDINGFLVEICTPVSS